MIVTAQQYAEKIGVSPSIVTRRLKDQNTTTPTLPGTKAIEKFGNTWRIELRKDFNAEKAGNSFRIYDKH